MSLTDDIKNIPKALKDSYVLTQGANAAKLLPKGTSFAIVGQIFAIKANQTHITVLKPKDYTFYLGYIALVGDEVQIITKEKVVEKLPLKGLKAIAMDPNVKIGEFELDVSANDGLMVGGSTGSAYSRGEGLTLISGIKKLYIRQVVPINPHPHGVHSSTAGWYAGFAPLLDRLDKAGVEVEKPSLLATKLIWGLTGLLFLAILIWWFISKKG